MSNPWLICIIDLHIKLGANSYGPSYSLINIGVLRVLPITDGYVDDSEPLIDTKFTIKFRRRLYVLNSFNRDKTIQLTNKQD